MEESKVQALHDTLSKLKKSAGLGVASHYNFGKVKTEEVDGKIVRADGLPNNPLYFSFVREGTYDKTKSDAQTYGDGRTIKRNFNDCKPIDGDSIGSSGEELDSTAKRKQKGKDKKKAEKKAAKLEAKRQVKLEAKRVAKVEERRLAKSNSSSKSPNVATIELKVKKHKEVRETEISKKRKLHDGIDNTDHDIDNSTSRTKSPKKGSRNDSEPSMIRVDDVGIESKKSKSEDSGSRDFDHSDSKEKKEKKKKRKK